MHTSWPVKMNLNTWESAPVEELFYVKGRIGWRGLRRSQFTNHGPYLITGMHINEGKVQWDDCFHISEDKFQESPEIIVEVGDIIITKDGTIGKVAYINDIPGPTSLNSHLFLVRPKVSRVDRRFAYHIFTSDLFNQHINDHRTGSTISGLSEKLFLRFELPLPLIQEQRLIADILDNIDTQIQSTEQLIAKLKLQRTGLLQNLLTYGLGEPGQQRYPIAYSEEFRESELGRIPKEWEIHHLGKIAEIGTGITLGKRLVGQGTVALPYLRVANVQDGYLDLADIKTIRLLEEDIPQYLLQSGDVLMTEGGDFDKLGRGTIWQGQIPICLHQNHIFRVRTDRRYLCPEFLTLISSSTYGKRFFVLCAKQSTNLASINSTQLKAFPIPCPPINEQKRILRVLHTLDSNIHAEEIQLNKLKLTKKGLMQDLLSGHIHVNMEEKMLSGEDFCARRPKDEEQYGSSSH